jgi:quercetin dioxygenase-like cupin family protein
MKRTKTFDLPWIGVSHDPTIKKQVFLERGAIPQLMTFAKAVFLPGQEVDQHVHKTMFEVFYILSGKAIFQVSGEDMMVETGDCLTIEPGEVHKQSNPFDEQVEWLYFGIATD